MIGNKWSKDSAARLATVDPMLAAVVNEALRACPFDIKVYTGHRGEKEQEQKFKAGWSKVHYPHSRHNSMPSRAVDIAPLNKHGSIDWGVDNPQWFVLYGVMAACASKHGVKLRWGGDWAGNGTYHESGLIDYSHYELTAGEGTIERTC